MIEVDHTTRADWRRLAALSEEEGGMGLSQRQAAAVLGVDHQTVNNDVRALGGEKSPREAEPVLVDEEPTGEYSPPRPHVANNAGDDEWHSPPTGSACRRLSG